ncbi:hypothetical protein ACP70R_033588 [Stipagrostis hirtigluma subsp. patula]
MLLSRGGGGGEQVSGTYTLDVNGDDDEAPERHDILVIPGGALLGWLYLGPLSEYCVQGWDNLPRTVLMYYYNFISSPEGYFHNVVCNADEFKKTTENHGLHYLSWDNPPKQHPHYLTMDDLNRMAASDAPFAWKFHADDPMLDKIDHEILFRGLDMPTPGG